MNSSESIQNKKNLILAAGFVAALFFTIFGMIWKPQEIPFPSEPYIIIAPIISTGISFGYWFGLTMNKDIDLDEGMLFYRAFFGFMSIFMIIFLFYQQTYIYPIFHIVTILMVYLFVVSGIIESDRVRNLKIAIQIFSDNLSLPILATYLISWYFGPITLEIKAVIAVALIILYGILKLLVSRVYDDYY